ncbi:MAG: hypothetical protein ACFFER_04820 [Candidatus Thorarchaeota archaeon]
MTRFVKIFCVVSLVMLCLTFPSALRIPRVHAQRITFDRKLVIDHNNRTSYILNLDEGETLVCWLRFQSGEGIYVYIQNSTERDLSLWSLPVSVHNETTFENEGGSWHHWSFVVPYSDSWSICFSKWDSEPFADSKSVLEIQVGSWRFSSNISVTVPQGTLSRQVYLPFSVKSITSPLDRVELHIDNEKVNTHWLSQVTLFMYEGSFLIDTLEWNNGNHSVKVTTYDSLGNRIEEKVFLITINNEFFDDPNNSFILILVYSLIIFALLMWKLVVKPIDEKEKWLHWGVLFGILGLLFVLAGSIIIGRNDLELPRGVLFLIGLISLNSTGVCSTYYLSARYTVNTIPSDEKTSEKTKKKQYTSLSIDQLLSRSDILDKTRGNIRTGASVILGIGSGISWWIINLNRLLSVIEYMFLIAGAGLAFFSVGGLLISFSHIVSDSTETSLSEDLIPEKLTKKQYSEQLKIIIRLKAKTLSHVRQAIGVGMLWFILLGLIGASLPIYFATTITPSYPLFAVTTLIPITIMLIAIVRFSRIVLGPRGLGLMKE